MNWTRGYLGEHDSEKFLAWLAVRAYGRLRLWVLGFSHLVLVVGWDRKGKQPHEDFVLPYRATLAVTGDNIRVTPDLMQQIKQEGNRQRVPFTRLIHEALEGIANEEAE